jgi:hypothetical protein
MFGLDTFRAGIAGFAEVIKEAYPDRECISLVSRGPFSNLRRYRVGSVRCSTLLEIAFVEL